MGFLRGGLLDNEVKEAIVGILRRGPRPIADLTHDVSERLDKPGLRVGQLTPVVLRLSEKGLLRVGGRGQGRICSLTLSGHEMARALAGGGASNAGELGDPDWVSATHDSSSAQQSEIEEFISAVCEKASVPIPARSGGEGI